MAFIELKKEVLLSHPVLQALVYPNWWNSLPVLLISYNLFLTSKFKYFFILKSIYSRKLEAPNRYYFI